MTGITNSSELVTTPAEAAAAVDIVTYYIPILLSLGAIILLIAWLPLILRKLPLTLPLICVLIGAAIFTFTPFADYGPYPAETPILIEKATELIVIISLMGAGLKIGRPFSFRGWQITVRMLAICMPLTILALLFLSGAMLGLGIVSALLLASCLAPTDPVLASDVQIEKPQCDEESEARFALTSEAGLNDALTFPFVNLAIALAVAGGFSWQTVGGWALEDVLIKLSVGLVTGLAAGWIFGKIVYALPTGTRLSRTGDGFVALGATLSIYALTELLHGYGFLAVFLAGLMLRRASRENDFNDRLHDFADETERLLMMVMLVFFGGMLASGGYLSAVGWREIGFAAVALFVVRPLAGMIGLIGVKRPPLERFIISFFGIRGLGSVYYLSYALNHAEFEQEIVLWEVMGLIILMSIILHGFLVTPLMGRLDRHLEGRQKSAEAA